eukprot:2067937-Amphidinium_carterae.1
MMIIYTYIYIYSQTTNPPHPKLAGSFWDLFWGWGSSGLGRSIGNMRPCSRELPTTIRLVHREARLWHYLSTSSSSAPARCHAH